MSAEAAAAAFGTPLPHLQDVIYLDFNATTPILPEVQRAMLPFTLEQVRVQQYCSNTRTSAWDAPRQPLADGIHRPEERLCPRCAVENDVTCA